MNTTRAEALWELQRIPGVGKVIAEDLWGLGCRRVADLKGGNAEELYERLCVLQGARVDRCMLYVLRCAIYFASNEEHDPEVLKWWRWKDSAPAPESAWWRSG